MVSEIRSGTGGVEIGDWSVARTACDSHINSKQSHQISLSKRRRKKEGRQEELTTHTEETKHKCNVKWIASNDGCPSVLRPVRSLQVEGEEGEEGGPDGGADGGGGREGRAGGGRSRGVGREGAGGRGGHDEDGAGDLSHLHCWWREREAYSDLVAAAASSSWCRSQA
ncbi:hypothetical protein BHE74_00008877 [Ensete ventricosum]|nr:hypothetical protein GW17_00039224 [Ensete ventricosum]RWW82653.1 hypothetical protein BHE74_00008877 [Ensete ventricosum]